MLEIDGIRLRIGEGEGLLARRALEKLGLKAPVWEVRSLRILRKSVDARKKADIRFVYRVGVTLGRADGKTVFEDRFSGKAGVRVCGGVRGAGLDCRNKSGNDVRTVAGNEELLSPVVVGFGPCGMFAALALARAGLKPIVLERGYPVEERAKAVAAFWRGGELDEDNNVLFGEGGAGTFSDGKLTSGIHDPRKAYVLDAFADAGGGEEIRYLASPHLGTDVLRTVVRNIRKEIIRLGGVILFTSKFVGFEVDGEGRLSRVLYKYAGKKKVAGCDWIAGTSPAMTGAASPDAGCGVQGVFARHLVLATGHSARDTLAVLREAGLSMARKPFSMGVRIEHRQQMIDESQYGRDFEKTYGMRMREAGLGAASYKLSTKTLDSRGVYTFCMCPGGTVITAASEKGGLFTNGMSSRARDGSYANSAVLVDVRPEDLPGEDLFAGIALQREMEQKAFKLAHERYEALTSTVGQFGNAEDRLAQCLPGFVVDGILYALPVFGRKIPGFDDPDVKLYGPETRSSCPVRVLRDETLQANVKGVFPCGEGAGYAGGIMSAAVDGLKAAERIVEECKSVR